MSNMRENLLYNQAILEGVHKATVQAWLNGNTVQLLVGETWIDTDNPAWAQECDYRVKPCPPLINKGYYKITLIHTREQHVMSYYEITECFVDRKGINWKLHEFLTTPELIC